MFSANMRTIPSLIVLILIAITAQAQPAEISGRVTIGKEPAAGVEVMILEWIRSCETNEDFKIEYRGVK